MNGQHALPTLVFLACLACVVDGDPPADSESGSETGEALACAEIDDAQVCADTQACGWALARTFADPLGCEELSSEGRCVETSYQGEGCLFSETCWDPLGANSFYQLHEDGSITVIAGSFCEYTPASSLGWNQCVFLSDDPMSAAHEGCACICD